MAGATIPIAQGSEELEAVTIVNLYKKGWNEVVTAGLG